MRPLLILLLAAGLAGTLLPAASAQSTVGPGGFQCIIRHPVTAQKMAALHVDEDRPFWATARTPRKGPPLIVYGSQFYQLPPILQRMLQHHECGHLELHTKDEFLANCYALRRLAEDDLLNASAIRLIRDEHCTLGELSEHHGGSGIAYWDSTRKLCSDLDLPPCEGR